MLKYSVSLIELVTETTSPSYPDSIANRTYLVSLIPT